MPELPEVETIVRTLAPQIEGRVVCGLRVLRESSLAAGRELVPALEGARITGARRRAKLAIVDLRDQKGEELSLVFHLKMTGRLFVHPADVEPHAHTRLIFSLRSDTAEAGQTVGIGQGVRKDVTTPQAAEQAENRVFRGDTLLFFDDVRAFGWCRLMRPRDFARWPFWNELGPEPFECSIEEFIARFRGRRGGIKALLLDQRRIAGIGNIYADEALFRARVHPAAPVHVLKTAQLRRLFASVREVLVEAVEQCGSSIRDYRDAAGNAGAFQNSFRVYGRAGRPCVACGGRLERILTAGRGTVFCPHCQGRREE